MPVSSGQHVPLITISVNASSSSELPDIFPADEAIQVVQLCVVLVVYRPELLCISGAELLNLACHLGSLLPDIGAREVGLCFGISRS
jgi:hypothetical protein